MGTRNLTAVMLNGKYVVAQYGQWDGMPSGQGATALEFCQNNLQTEITKDLFKSQLSRVRFLEDEELEKILEEIGSVNHMLTPEQAEKYNDRLPYLSRDHGAEILNLIFQSTENKDILLRDEIDFAKDSLFCEYAYVIDLDKNTFEAYKGFQHDPISPEERFYDANIEQRPGSSEMYYPIKMVARWDLNKLPTFDEFSDAFSSGNEEDEENEEA